MAGEGRGYVPPEAYEGSAVKNLEDAEAGAESQEETYNIHATMCEDGSP